MPTRYYYHVLPLRRRPRRTIRLTSRKSKPKRRNKVTYRRNPKGLSTYPVRSRTMNTFPERMTMKMRMFYWAEESISTNTFAQLGTVKSCLGQCIRTGPNINSWSVHRPMYTNEMSALYGKYIVYGIKYRITIMGEYAATEGWYGGVMHSDSDTTETDILAAMERGQGKWRAIRNGTGGNGRLVLTGYMDVARTMGRTRLQSKVQGGMEAVFPSDPTYTAYLKAYVFNTSPGGIAEGYHVAWDLTYYVTWFDRTDVAASNATQ